MVGQRFAVAPGWQLLLKDLGLSVSCLLKKAGLSADLFARQTSLAPAEYFRLWAVVHDSLGPTAPLLLGQAFSTESFSPPIFASLCSQDFNQALTRLQKYKPLIGPMRLTLNISAESTRLELHFDPAIGSLPPGLGAAELVFLVKLLRLATREQVVPLAVSMAPLPTELVPFEAFFGVRPQAGINSLTFSAPDARRSFLTFDGAMWDFFEPGLNQRLAELSSKASARERLAAVLFELLPSGDSRIDTVARRLAMSRRSLQRQLAAEGTHFQAELGDARVKLARNYLGQSALSLQEIAFLLGFSDGNAFMRFFKERTGQTAGDYRQRPSQ
ncbi:helix-turn-helix domain-containing protein [Gallaecimonas pentaromativorans]|uniref:helix-turn-helix domain-containing protein n=1 Tax=Gallaecimonas pentaromativorans TaxID=584787 RepID=UPI003A8EAA3A